jgi:hypothetical protein
MSSKQQAQSKVQKPEPARQTAVSEAAQVGPDLLPAGLGQIESLNGLPSHGTARRVRQTALLCLQQRYGNNYVQRQLAQRCKNTPCTCGNCHEGLYQQLAPEVQRDNGSSAPAPVTLTNPQIIVRPARLTWHRWTASITENSPTNYTAGVGCLPERTIFYTVAGRVFIRSRDSGDEIPYTLTNHSHHFPGRPFLSDVGITIRIHHPDITFSTNQVTSLTADGRFVNEFNQTRLRQAVRSLDMRLVLRDPGLTDGAASHLTLQSIQGPDELISVCEDALAADFAAAAASAQAEQQAGRVEPLQTGAPAGAIPVDAGQLDRINYYLRAVGLQMGEDGLLQMTPDWTAPDRWCWIARNQIWNESQNPQSQMWTARTIYDWLRQVRDSFYNQNAPPISFSVFIGELRRYEDEHPDQSIDDVIRALRRAGHERTLPFDQVIGVPPGQHEEYSTGAVGGPLQFLKDHNQVSVGGRVVDMYHLAVGLEALPLDRPDVELEIPLGRITLIMPTEMESAAASTWAGDVGSALADWMMGVDVRNEPSGTLEAKLDYYWNTRVSQADLDGDIEAWGIHNSRSDLPANLRRLSDLLLHHYGGGRANISRREAYQEFAQYYSEPGSSQIDVRRLRHQIMEFARMWLLNRLGQGYSPRYNMDEFEWAADELTSKFLIHVEDQL